jgi:uncharacterized protein YecE (DUF72 family)
MTRRKPRIRIGVGGWSYKPWRGEFYPEDLVQRRELEYASRKLSSIEINSTFYGLQSAATFAKWYAETPKDFVFAVKGPRFVTGRRVLADAGKSLERFLGSGVLQLKEKLGPINWQFGPERQFDSDDFDAFLKLLPARKGGLSLRHAIELRNPSFNTPVLVAMARKYGVAVVFAGDSEFPRFKEPTAPFVYARIMGTTKTQKNGYSTSKLNSWARQAESWTSGGRDVFLYVISGFKERNPAAAMRLIERLD